MPWLLQAVFLSGAPHSPAFVVLESCSRVALGAPVGFFVAVLPSPIGCFELQVLLADAGRATDSWSLPLAPARAGVLGLLCIAPARSQDVLLLLAGSSGVGLMVFAVRCFVACGPGHVSAFLYCPSSDSVLGRFTRGVSCGRQHLPLWVRGHHASVSCICLLFLAGSGWPASQAFFRLSQHFFAHERGARCLFRCLRAGVVLVL